MADQLLSNDAPLVESKTLDFILAIPLVNETLDYFLGLIHHSPVAYRTWMLVVSFTALVLTLVRPLIYVFGSLLRLLDNTAYSTLSTIKKQVPYPFEVHWSQLSDRAQTEVDAARATAQNMYETRVKEPYQRVYEQTGKAVEQLQQNENIYIQKAGNALISINDNLSKLATQWDEKTSKEIQKDEKQVQSLVQHLFSELENLHQYALSLPVEGRKRFQPLIDSFNSTYKDLYSEAFNTSIPVQERVGRVLNYLRQETLPALHKALMSSLTKASKKGKQSKKEAAESVENAESVAAQKIHEAHATTADTISSVLEKVAPSK